MEPEPPRNSLGIGKNLSINHNWCLIFGNDLKTTRDYDIQIGAEVNLPANRDFADIKSWLYEHLQRCKNHDSGKDHETWISNVENAILGVMSTIEKVTNCCNTKDCGQKGSLICSGCKRVKYCSKKCHSEDWPNHKQWCVRVEVIDRPESEFKSMLFGLSLVSKFVPSTALEKGLFSKFDISKGEIVCTFRGNLAKSEEEPIEKDESLFFKWQIYIDENHIYRLSPEDMAHYAVDPSYTLKKPRNFMKVLNSENSLITSFCVEGKDPTNTSLVLFPEGSNVVLVATRDIKKGEEIFFHRGPAYHFLREHQRGWKITKGQILPEELYSSKGFEAYVLYKYPSATDIFFDRDPTKDFLQLCKEKNTPRKEINFHRQKLLESHDFEILATFSLSDYRLFLKM
jgi:hypothetical protein